MREVEFKIKGRGPRGIYVRINGEILYQELGEYSISDALYLKISTIAKWTDDDLNMIKKGILWSRKQTRKNIPPQCIHIHNIDLNFVDFIPESLFWSIALWLSVPWEFELPQITLDYDQTSKKYSLKPPSGSM